jgi:hypothetical protein
MVFGERVAHVSGPALPASGDVMTWSVGILPGTPPSGLVVNLTSSNINVATVPATVAVPGLGAVASFPVTITGPGSATITASLQGTSKASPVGFNVQSLSGPAAPPAGNVATWTVQIDATAGAAGAIVNLASGNSAVASVPPTVTIVNGSSVTFPVTSLGPGQATLTASAPGSSVTGLFGLDIAALTIDATTITGVGNAAVGTVTLTGPTPAGGTVVDVTTTSTALSVPATVTVPAGATTATFNVTAATAPSTGRVIVAVAGAVAGVSKSVTVHTTP